MSEAAYIPFHLPSIGEEEIAEVVATLRSGWLTTGERAQRFERDFRDYCGARNALALSSCTAGLHLALAGLGIGPGDEVITTPLTFCATVNSIIHVGATPVLADVGADGNLCAESVEARITSNTKAVLPVHLAGIPCDMESIWKLARRSFLHVVEDAAHAAGSTYRGLPLGSAALQSDAVVFSFYATKNITTGEGGMITTNNDELAARMRILALHGISKDAWKRYAESGSWYYEVVEPGFKYNLSDIQAAIGIHQLKKINTFAAARRERAEWYNRRFQEVAEIEIPPQGDGESNSWHLYMLRLQLDKLWISRDEFMLELKRRGVGASVHFIPIPHHPFFAPWAERAENQCPRAMELYKRLISLPLFPSMTEEQSGRVADAVLGIVEQNRRRVYAVAV